LVRPVLRVLRVRLGLLVLPVLPVRVLLWRLVRLQPAPLVVRHRSQTPVAPLLLYLISLFRLGRRVRLVLRVQLARLVLKV